MKTLGGVYLVIDPSKDWAELLDKLHSALKGGVQILQIWNHWQEDLEKSLQLDFIKQVKSLASQFSVPVLMHDDWSLVLEAKLDGVHFDEIPNSLEDVRKVMPNKYIGLTVEKIKWAEEQSVSYISFCALFPSSSVDTCEIVRPDMIKKAREITQIPIFLSGGINLSNIERLAQLPFNGIAVISGILASKKPEEAARQYVNKLIELKIAH